MSKKILLVGDIHGEFSNYFKIVRNFKFPSIQLGDMGIGFSNKKYNLKFPISKNHKFIRGNHDNPNICKKHPNYLGDYGITKDGIFYISGAYSVDKDRRTIGVDWWDDEELSILKFNKVLTLYEKEKPKIVISHSQPTEIIDSLFRHRIRSKTQEYLSEMFKIHQPEKWISGHLHKNYKVNIENTEFIGIDSLYYYVLEI